MKQLLLGLLLLLIGSTSHAQWENVPVQCYGGCCPGGCCPSPQPYYQSQPQPQAQPQPDVAPIDGGETFEERSPLPAPPIATPPLPTPPQPTAPPAQACDCGPKIEALIAAVKAGGCKCDNSKLEAAIAELTAAVKAQKGCACDNSKLEAKIDQLITAIGNQKPPATDTTQPQTEEHVIIVADHNAPYWQRLAEAINNAKKTYSGIQDTTLPTFPIGNHPQAVVYRNSVPVRIVKGQYEVEALLSRLARGEPI